MLLSSKRFRLISLFLATTFLIQDVSWAMPEIQAHLPSRPVMPEVRFKLPNSVGLIEDFHTAPRAQKTVILLQDAHTNESGQINISKALDIILREEQIPYVFLEAGTGDASLSYIRPYADRAKREAVSMSYLRKGMLQGSEYLDATSELEFALWGVENPDLYAQALKAYAFIVDHRDEFKSYLSQIETTINVLRPKIYNPDLMAFDDLRRQYQDQKVPLAAYLETVFEEAARQKIALNDYPHLKTLKRVMQKESKIDFKKAGNEEAEALKSLSEEDLQLLKQARAGNRSPSKLFFEAEKEKMAFFSLLKEKVGDLARYPELSKYVQYLEAAQNIDPKATLEEQEGIEARIYGALLETDDEQRLHQADEGLKHFQGLLLLKLTPDDFVRYLGHARQYGLVDIAAFLNSKLMDLKSYYEKSLFLEEGFDELVHTSEDFYRLTYERDMAIVRNMLQKMDDQDLSKAVLITGGYHTPNLKALLKKNGVSFVSVTPQVLHPTDHNRYEKLLLSQLTSVKESVIAKKAAAKDADSAAMVKQMRFEPWLGAYETDIAGKVLSDSRRAPAVVQAVAAAKLPRLRRFLRGATQMPVGGRGAGIIKAIQLIPLVDMKALDLFRSAFSGGSFSEPEKKPELAALQKAFGGKTWEQIQTDIGYAKSGGWFSDEKAVSNAIGERYREMRNEARQRTLEAIKGVNYLGAIWWANNLLRNSEKEPSSATLDIWEQKLGVKGKEAVRIIIENSNAGGDVAAALTEKSRLLRVDAHNFVKDDVDAALQTFVSRRPGDLTIEELDLNVIALEHAMYLNLDRDPITRKPERQRALQLLEKALAPAIKSLDSEYKLDLTGLAVLKFILGRAQIDALIMELKAKANKLFTDRYQAEKAPAKAAPPVRVTSTILPPPAPSTGKTIASPSVKDGDVFLNPSSGTVRVVSVDKDNDIVKTKVLTLNLDRQSGIYNVVGGNEPDVNVQEFDQRVKRGGYHKINPTIRTLMNKLLDEKFWTPDVTSTRGREITLYVKASKSGEIIDEYRGGTFSNWNEYATLVKTLEQPSKITVDYGSYKGTGNILPLIIAAERATEELAKGSRLNNKVTGLILAAVMTGAVAVYWWFRRAPQPVAAPVEGPIGIEAPALPQPPQAGQVIWAQTRDRKTLPAYRVNEVLKTVEGPGEAKATDFANNVDYRIRQPLAQPIDVKAGQGIVITLPEVFRKAEQGLTITVRTGDGILASAQRFLDSTPSENGKLWVTVPVDRDATVTEIDIMHWNNRPLNEPTPLPFRFDAIQFVRLTRLVPALDSRGFVIPGFFTRNTTRFYVADEKINRSIGVTADGRIWYNLGVDRPNIFIYYPDYRYMMVHDQKTTVDAKTGKKSYEDMGPRDTHSAWTDFFLYNSHISFMLNGAQELLAKGSNLTDEQKTRLQDVVEALQNELVQASPADAMTRRGVAPENMEAFAFLDKKLGVSVSINDDRIFVNEKTNPAYWFEYHPRSRSIVIRTDGVAGEKRDRYVTGVPAFSYSALFQDHAEKYKKALRDMVTEINKALDGSNLNQAERDRLNQIKNALMAEQKNLFPKGSRVQGDYEGTYTISEIPAVVDSILARRGFNVIYVGDVTLPALSDVTTQVKEALDPDAAEYVIYSNTANGRVSIQPLYAGSRITNDMASEVTKAIGTLKYQQNTAESLTVRSHVKIEGSNSVRMPIGDLPLQPSDISAPDLVWDKVFSYLTRSLESSIQGSSANIVSYNLKVVTAQDREFPETGVPVDKGTHHWIDVTVTVKPARSFFATAGSSTSGPRGRFGTIRGSRWAIQSFMDAVGNTALIKVTSNLEAAPLAYDGNTEYVFKFADREADGFKVTYSKAGLAVTPILNGIEQAAEVIDANLRAQQYAQIISIVEGYRNPSAEAPIDVYAFAAGSRLKQILSRTDDAKQWQFNDISYLVNSQSKNLAIDNYRIMRRGDARKEITEDIAYDVTITDPESSASRQIRVVFSTKTEYANKRVSAKIKYVNFRLLDGKGNMLLTSGKQLISRQYTHTMDRTLLTGFIDANRGLAKLAEAQGKQAEIEDTTAGSRATHGSLDFSDTVKVAIKDLNAAEFADRLRALEALRKAEIAKEAIPFVELVSPDDIPQTKSVQQAVWAAHKLGYGTVAIPQGFDEEVEISLSIVNLRSRIQLKLAERPIIIRAFEVPDKVLDLLRDPQYTRVRIEGGKGEPVTLSLRLGMRGVGQTAASYFAPILQRIRVELAKQGPANTQYEITSDFTSENNFLIITPVPAEPIGSRLSDERLSAPALERLTGYVAGVLGVFGPRIAQAATVEQLPVRIEGVRILGLSKKDDGTFAVNDVTGGDAFTVDLRTANNAAALNTARLAASKVWEGMEAIGASEAIFKEIAGRIIVDESAPPVVAQIDLALFSKLTKNQRRAQILATAATFMAQGVSVVFVGGKERAIEQAEKQARRLESDPKIRSKRAVVITDGKFPEGAAFVHLHASDRTFNTRADRTYYISLDRFTQDGYVPIHQITRIGVLTAKTVKRLPDGTLDAQSIQAPLVSLWKTAMPAKKKGIGVAEMVLVINANAEGRRFAFGAVMKVDLNQWLTLIKHIMSEVDVRA